MTREDRRALLGRLLRDACELGGHLPPETRRAAAAGEPLPGAGEATSQLADQIRHAAQTVTDAEIAAARAEGQDDDSLYELTVATALGESRRRFDAVLRALKRGGA
jgi:hypothetical protein